MAQAKSGDTVKVNYTGKLEDGTIFDSSANRDPLEFKIGEGQVILGFEKAIIGMNPGDSKDIEISANEKIIKHNCHDFQTKRAHDKKFIEVDDSSRYIFLIDVARTGCYKDRNPVSSILCGFS